MGAFRYSALDTAHRCLYLYKRRYIDAVELPGFDSLDTHFGSALHAGLEALLTGNDGLQVFRIYWASMEGKDLAQSRFNWHQLLTLGQMFLERFARLHAKRFEPFMLEQTLTGKIGAYEVTGTPDYIGLYKGIPSIVDFKTSNKEYVREKILVNEQMPIYAEMARQAFGYEVKQLVYYVFVKSEGRIQTLVLPVDAAGIAGRLQNVEAMCEELTGRTRYPKNPNNCMMGTIRCPLFAECHGKEPENGKAEP